MFAKLLLPTKATLHVLTIYQECNLCMSCVQNAHSSAQIADG